MMMWRREEALGIIEDVADEFSEHEDAVRDRSRKKLKHDAIGRAIDCLSKAIP
jgi:hypothetical protein